MIKKISVLGLIVTLVLTLSVCHAEEPYEIQAALQRLESAKARYEEVKGTLSDEQKQIFPHFR